MTKAESEPSSEQDDEPGILYPDTQTLVDSLLADPKQLLMCSHGGEPAVGVYEVPGGCVALPGLETQCLCPQHVITNGSFDGMTLIVDLSLNGQWSNMQYVIGDPMYWMQLQDDGSVIMRATTDFPIPS